MSLAKVNKLTFKGKRYKAVELKRGEICGDCEFIIRDPKSKLLCKLSGNEAECAGDKRSDGRNIYWKQIKTRKKKK
jgi:hypothetical protein